MAYPGQFRDGWAEPVGNELWRIFAEEDRLGHHLERGDDVVILIPTHGARRHAAFFTDGNRKVKTLDCLVSQHYDGPCARKKIEARDGYLGSRGKVEK